MDMPQLDVQSALEAVDTNARTREAAITAAAQPLNANLTSLAGISRAGTIFFRADGTPAILLSTIGAGVDTATATNLTGTTGVDGRFTVAVNNGQIQFENRRGFVVAYRYFVTGFSSAL